MFFLQSRSRCRAFHNCIVMYSHYRVMNEPGSRLTFSACLYLGRVKGRGMRRFVQAWLLSGALLFTSVTPMIAQRSDNNQRGRQEESRGAPQQNGHANYYSGMNQTVRQGNYGRYAADDERRHHHDDSGGIGPGKAAAIGGAGGAVLGAVFGGGLKGTIIGGAAGAGIGAIAGKLAQGDDHDRHH